MSLSPSPQPAAAVAGTTSKDSSTATIDRQTTTPFLLNFCYRSSAFHNLTDFPIPTPSDPKPPLPAHLQIYTWYSCTLKELAHLLTSALPGIVPDPAIGTRLSFRLVYPDTSHGAGRGLRLDEGRPRYVTRELGSVVISVPSHANGNGDAKAAFELGGEDAEKTLAESRFVIGDFIDCAVFPPLSDGSVVPRNSVGGRGGYRGENGYGRSRGANYGSGRGSGYGGGTGGRGDFGASIPTGEWRRGERLPESGPYGRGSSRGGYGGGRGARREPY